MKDLTAPESYRIIDIINWGRRLFLRRNFSHARYNIEVLLEHILGKKRAELYLDCDYELSKREAGLLLDCVSKRLDNWPLWHLVGTVEFYGFPVRVDGRVLIPRPETELVVDLALKELANYPGRGVRYLADVGTGSGNIAAAVARARNDVFIYAVDISGEALELAEENTKRLGVDGYISLIEGDLLGPFSERSLDMVLSNPPYVAASEWRELPGDVRDREPRIALCGGEDGLDLIRKLVSEASSRLLPGGCVIMEMGKGQGPLVKGLIEASGAYGGVEIHKDYSGIDRVALARTI